MSDTFLNNQEVTASDLNHIAIDLGYPEYSHFPENPPQSAVSALNQITADLTGAGLLMVGNRCKVTISGNTITVQDGVCVFANGAKKRIEESVSLEYIEGDTNYVYLYNDFAGNKIEVINSLTKPNSSDDYVMLATITNKKVADKRRLSTSKVATFGTHPVLELNGSYAVTKDKVLAGEPFLTFDIGVGYTHMILTTNGENSIAICNLQTGVFEKVLRTSYSSIHTNENTFAISYWGDVYISYIDGIISFKSTKDLYSTINLSASVYLTDF